MDYDSLIEVLKSNHFYPVTEMTRYKDGNKITGLRVDAQPILQDSKKERLEEVLKDYPVKIEILSNVDYILITLKKTKK